MKSNYLDKEFFEKCINSLEKSFELYQNAKKDAIEKNIYRSASIKEFEIILEQSAKLVKKILKDFVVSSIEIDRLHFKDVFRKASQFDLLSLEESQRWLEYRDNRNQTAHEYGSGFAENIIEILERFIKDAKKIVEIIEKHNHAN
jgi:nucleotidyltransferase substrate binding protein (TIGR01987 family)